LMSDYSLESLLELLKEWRVEGIDPKKHAASGNLDAFSFDLASLLLSLFVFKTHEKVIPHAPETIKTVADEMQKAKLVRKTEDNRCEMVEPNVAEHYPFLSDIATIEALRKNQLSGFHSLIWQLLTVLYQVMSNDSVPTEKTKFVLLPLDPLIWTPKNKADTLIRPSHRLMTLKTKFGFVSSGSPIESNLFSQGDPKFMPVAYILPNPVFQKPCGCELEYPSLFSEGMLPHPIAFVGTQKQLDNLEVLLHESLLGPSKEHWDMDEWISASVTSPSSPSGPVWPHNATVQQPKTPPVDFDAERREIVPETWPAHSPENLRSCHSCHAFNEDGVVEIELPVVGDHSAEAPARGKLRVQHNHGFFTVFEDGELVLAFDGEFQHLKHGKIRKPLLCKSLVPNQCPVPPGWTPPPFGVTFFSNCRACVSCCRTITFIIWVNGKGFLVDPCSGCYNHLSASGIMPLISCIILSHVHTDTLGGVLPLLQAKDTHRLPLLTTRTIFESLRRQISGFAQIPATVDFRPVHLREPFFFGGCSMVFCYAMHSVPTLAFQVEYSSKKIWFSSPCLYKPSLYTKMCNEGTMTLQREAELLHFGCDGNVAIHGVGLPPFHTDIKKVMALPVTIRQSVVLVNLSRGQDFTELQTTNLRVAEYGFVNTLALDLGSFGQGYVRGAEVVKLLCNAPYLCNLSAPDISTIMSSMNEQRYEEGVVIVEGNDNKHKHTIYLIESGTAEMFNSDKALSFPFNVPMSELGRGDLFADTEGILCKVVAKTPMSVFAFSEKVLHSCCSGASSSSFGTKSGSGGSGMRCSVGSDVLRALRFRSFLIQTFSQSSMFRSLTHEQISLLASCVSDEIHLSVNERLIKQGDTSDRSIYIIREGTLGIFVSRADFPRAMEMARVGPGSCVGEMACLQAKPRSADVVAMTPACVLRVKQEEMDLVMQKYPQIRFILDSVIRSRIDGIPSSNQFRAPRPRLPVTISVIPRTINTDSNPPPAFVAPISPRSPHGSRSHQP